MSSLTEYVWDYERIGLNASQERAIERFLGFIEEGLRTIGEEVIDSVTIESAACRNTRWLKLTTEYSEAKGTLLDALSSQHWLIHVGPRGSLDAKMYPKSFEQFIGKRRRHHSGCRFSKKV